MNLHPALLAVIVVDVLGALVLALASIGAVRVTLGWKCGEATRAQLSLERASEEVSALARLGLVLLASGGVLLIIVVNHVLPAIVPGAMCGVGALQAMPGGQLALWVRGMALGALWIWAVVDALNRSAPIAPLATAATRALLVSAPVAFVAAWQTAQALLHVDVQQPVSCCAAVYDLAKVGETGGGAAVAGPWHAVVAVMGLVAVVMGAVVMRRRASHALPPAWATVVWGAVVVAWTGLAAWVLVDVAGPYLYGVLGHRCPLCFFLPHHFGVGYGLYGALAVVVAGALAIGTSVVTGTRCEAVEERARGMVRRSVVAVLVGAVVFLVLAGGPALYWRVQFGVWIGG